MDALRVLLIEDSENDADLIKQQFHRADLSCHFFRVQTMMELQQVLESSQWDVVLSDFSLPTLSAIEAVAEVVALRPGLPVLLVSGSVGEERAATVMRLGARDYILKGNLTRLVPAVLREVEEARMVARNETLRRDLEDSRRRLEKLCRYFPRPIAEKVTHDAPDPFEWHRSHVSVVFVDLRGFSGLVELAEPEDVVRLLNDYYSRVGQVVVEFGGTIGHVAGDGVMMFFNDPVKLPNPEQTAVNAALRLRETLGQLRQEWIAADFKIDFGAGIASGYATVGLLGVEGCWDYSIIGTVTNVAARLCAAAQAGQILVPQRIVSKINIETVLEAAGAQQFKGLRQLINVFNVVGLKKVA